MDNHPIPQDVTGFQFRLIGNMTVKQFAYVAVGAVGAVVIFYIPMIILIKIILIPLFIIAGVVLAFVPVEGRPIDIMVTHFLQAVFAPTQFIYKKNGGQLLLSTIHIDQKVINQAAQAEATGTSIPSHTQEQRNAERQQQLANYLSSIQKNQAPDDKEAQRLSALFGPTQPASVASVPAQTPVSIPQVAPAIQPAVVETSLQPLPAQPEAPVTPQAPVAPVMPAAEMQPATPTMSAEETDNILQIQKDTEKIAEEDSLLLQTNEELTRAKAQEQSVTGQEGQTAHQKVLELEQKLKEIQQAKQQLEQEITSLKVATKKIVSAPQIPAVPVSQPAPVAQPAAAPVTPPTNTAGFPSLPEDPGILLGVVRDSSGNVLPNILIEVRDTEENPVRAFKTNQLGQFLSATQLKEGTYTVILEDPKNQYKFDPVTVTVTNQILQPLEVSAHDLREELRKSLFA